MKTKLEDNEYILSFVFDTSIEATKISNMFKEINIRLGYIKVVNLKCKYITDEQINLLTEHIKKKKEKRNTLISFSYEKLVDKLKNRIDLIREFNINKYERFYDWSNLK